MQELAIYKRGENIIVSAGAGSGKTAVLSERILDYCLNGGDIRRLLVLTFTEAAASEMKERIRAKLIDNNLLEQADYIDAAYISTFDAYSLSLVKKYSYKLGVSRNISIMDGALIALKRKAIIEEIFTELYDLKDARFFSYLTKYSNQDDKAVVNTIENLCAKFELIIDYDSFIANYENAYFSDEKLNRISDEYVILCKNKISEYKLAIDNYISALRLDENAKKPYDETTDYINELDSLIEYNQLYKFIQERKLPLASSKSIDQSVRDERSKAASILKELKDYYFNKYTNEQEMKDDILKIKDDVLFLLDICVEVKNRLSLYKKSVMLYDYSDIAKMAIELVTKHDDVQNELKYYFNEILVDEYQDTSDMQEAFLSQIENNNMYMVGDIKQSIYRFRNANPYIFKNKYDSYAKGENGFKIDLAHNFRSRSEVLDNINLLFNQLMTESCGDANYVLDHQMNYGQKMYESLNQEVDFNIECLKYADEESFDQFTQEEKEAFIIARSIKEIMENNPKILKGKDFKDISYNDFAILVDKSKSFVTFKKIFEYLNIPLSIEADLDLKDSPLSKLFVNIILALSKIRNNELDVKFKHAITAISRSFIYQYEDSDIFDLIVHNKHYQILDDFNDLAEFEDISYSKLFYDICFKLGIYDKLGRIGDVDASLVALESIHNLLCSLEAANMSFDEMANYLVDLFNSDIDIKYKVSSISKNSVRIMTIHKSKGLEFAYCYFPLLSSGFNKGEIKASVGFHIDYGIYIPYVDENKSNTIIKSLIANRLSKDDISERVRLLYVALTRAREKMILIHNSKYDEKELPSSPDKFNSFLDMLMYYDSYKPYTRKIKLASCNLTLQYKKQLKSSVKSIGKEKLSYDDNIKYDELKSVKISKELKKLPDANTKSSIKLGLEFHSALEALDFSNPSINSLPVSDFIKDRITNVLAHDVFKDMKKAKSYHEYEFYYNDKNNEYHGIIDLLMIYDDHIDIIDYKLSNVDSPEYIRQLSIYKDYVKTKYDKKINVYLLSILKASITKLDV